MEIKKYLVSSSVIIILFITGCNKDEFLNEKPQQSILTPSKIEDYQALLDRDDVINGMGGQGVTPQLAESAADNIYILDANFNTNLRPQMQNYYTWSATPYQGVEVLDWTYPYRAILYVNAVIEGLEKENQSTQNSDLAKGLVAQAFFHRAHHYYQLAQVFAPPYNIGGSNTELSIPLRISADINEPLQRSTVQQTYDFVINDLKSAIPYLPTQVIYRHRPSKQAAYGLLSRINLTMRNYAQAKVYADSCLAIQGELLDYNTVNASASYPFGGGYNSLIVKEVIFLSAMLSDQSQNYPITYNNGLVNTDLYNSYNEFDLRKKIFFQARPVGFRFKGTYCFLPAQNLYFSGIAVDEILLNRAECLARAGNITDALQDINALLKSRWDKQQTFIPYNGLNQNQALELILQERRKELIYRGLRWSDIRRLNLENYNISLSRTVNGTSYTLPANDARWVFPLPPEVLVK